MRDKDLQRELWRKSTDFDTLEKVLGAIRASEAAAENHGLNGYNNYNIHHGLNGYNNYNIHHGPNGYNNYNIHHVPNGYNNYNIHHGPKG